MKNINFNNKKFSLIENTKNGKADSETVFEYKQEGNLVTANDYGGSIKYGKIIAFLEKDKLDMMYQCATINNELKAGKAVAKINVTEKGKIKLKLNWEWLNNTNEKGVSEYIEK